MDDNLASLMAASIAFLGTHFAMSHPLRAGLVRLLGERGFLALYSLVSVLTLGWMIIAFRAIGPGRWPAWNGQGNLLWVIASLLTVIALALLFGSLRGNPALPQTGVAAVTGAQASGVYAVTRHPMMWGFALWAVAHILVMPTARQGVLAGAILILALVGAHLQDRKKAALIGPAWREWEARTSFWPRLDRLGGIGWGLWLAAVAGWLVITWLHVWLAYVPAGVWRWLG